MTDKKPKAKKANQEEAKELTPKEKRARLKERLKTMSDAHKKQLNENHVLRQELKGLKNLVKDDTVEQLKIKTKAIQTKTKKINSLEERVSGAIAYIEGIRDSSDPIYDVGHIVSKLMLQGYHSQRRYFYLDSLKKRDWDTMLDYFQSAPSGFDALESLRPLFEPWIHNYHALIDVIEDQGYKILPLESYADNGFTDEKSIYVYHDVHAWDIIPAMGMALANRDRGINTTFCLNIDQAAVDIDHESGYRIFGTLAGENVQVGLHCNPFASWVRMDVFDGDEEKFLDWFKSGKALDNIKALLADKPAKQRGIFEAFTCKDAENFTFKRLKKNFDKLRSFHPTARAANHHGDLINQLFKSLSVEEKRDNNFLIVAGALRDKRSEKIGVLASPTGIYDSHSTAKIYAELPNRTQYFENLFSELSSGETRQLINHPGVISNGGLAMNLDFVRELQSGCYEDYLPHDRMIKKTPKPKAPLEIAEE